MKNNNLNSSIRQKRRIPRILSLVLALVMVITSVPNTALASEILVEQILVEDDAAPAQGISADAVPADVSAQPAYSVSPAQQDDGLIIEGAEVIGGTDTAAGQEAQQDDVEEIWLGDIEEIGEPVSMDTEQPADQGSLLPEEGTAQSTGTDAADGADPEAEQIIEEAVELGEAEEISAEGMEEIPGAEEEDVVDLAAADTPMTIAEDFDRTFNLKFEEEDGKIPSAEKLQVLGAYAGITGSGIGEAKDLVEQALLKNENNIIIDKIPEISDLNDIQFTYKFSGQSRVNRYLFIQVSTKYYEILNWKITDQELQKSMEVNPNALENAYGKSILSKSFGINKPAVKVAQDLTDDVSTLFIITSGVGTTFPNLEITYQVKEKAEEEIQQPATFRAVPAEHIDKEEISKSKLYLSFEDKDPFLGSGKEFNEGKQEDGSVQKTKHPSSLSEDGPYVIEVQQTGLEGKYKVSGWEIAPEGEEQPFTNINDIGELSDSSLAQYTYEPNGVTVDGGTLSITIPGKKLLAGFTVRPILEKVQRSFSIRAYTAPEAAGLKIVKMQKKFSGGEAASDGITAVPENQQMDVSALYEGEDADAAAVGWKVYLDKSWYEDAYENLRAELYQGEELVKTVPFGGEEVQATDEGAGFTAGWKADGASEAFLSFQEEALEEQNYLVFTVCGTAPGQYTQDGKAVSVRFAADKKDVAFSIQQDRQTGSKFSYTLKKTEGKVATELASGKNTIPSEKVLYTLPAKGEVQDGQPQVVLDPDAVYELKVKLESRDQAFALKGWTINGKEIKETGYPQEVSVEETAAAVETSLTVTAKGSYLPLLQIGVKFELSAQKLEALTPDPRPADDRSYSLYLVEMETAEDGTQKDGTTTQLLNKQKTGSGYLEARQVKSGSSYKLRAEITLPVKDNVWGSNYIHGWNVSENLKTLSGQAEDDGWKLTEILSVLSETDARLGRVKHGYETLEVEFTGDEFLSYLKEQDGKAIKETADSWTFQACADQIGADDPIYTATVSINEEEYGEARAEFVKNLEDKSGSIWNLKAVPKSSQEISYWGEKKEDGVFERIEDSDGCYRYQVTVTADTEYQAAFGLLDIKFTGEYMATLPVDMTYKGYSEVETDFMADYDMGKIENGCFVVGGYPGLQLFQITPENMGRQMTSYQPAALLFLMDLPLLTGKFMEFKLYEGTEAKGEPFKIAVFPIKQGRGAGEQKVLVGVDSLPYTEYVTITARTSDGRTAQKTYQLYPKPLEGKKEKEDYIQQLREVYEKGVDEIRKVHKPDSVVYSSEYIMLTDEFQKAVAEIGDPDKETQEAVFNKAKELLESIGKGIIPADVGIRVGGYGAVAALPNGVSVYDAMSALMEKKTPGTWTFHIYWSQFGAWVNEAHTGGGLGRVVEDSFQSGAWQYTIRGYNGKTYYNEYAPLGVTSQIMVDGDYIVAPSCTVPKDQEWALQCLGICKGKEAEVAERSAGTSVEEMEAKYGVTLQKGGFPKPIMDWIDAINAVAPVTLGSSFGHSWNESAINADNLEEVGQKIAAIEAATPTGVYAKRMNNSEWGKAAKEMKERYETLKAGHLDNLDNDPEDNRTGVQSYLGETVGNKELGYGNEWDVFALAQSGVLAEEGKQEIGEKYLAGLDKNLETIFDSLGDAQGELGGYTEYERVVLTLTSLGKDASRYEASGETYDFIEKLLDYESVTKQGLNAVDYALIALDSGNYDKGNQEIRNRYIEYILAAQTEDGGWNLNEGLGAADTDMTAMTLQALAPYYSKASVAAVSVEAENIDTGKVNEAVEKGLAALKGLQNSLYGDFGYSGGGYNAESTAQVLVALSALGIDGAGKDWTTSYGGTVVSGLLRYYVTIEGQEGMGAFSHDGGSTPDEMATQQAAYALEAYRRFKAGAEEKRLYDMTDKVNSNSAHSYQVTVSQADGGTVTVNPESNVLPGANVTVTVETKEGYEFVSLTADGKAVTMTAGSGRFMMPVHDVAVAAEFKAKESESESESEKDPGTTDPSNPGTTDPSDPGTTDPSDPGTTDPSDPGTTDPSDPGTTDPSDPGTTDPSNPGTTDPSNPGTTDPSDPGTTDPSNPGTTDPSDPGTTDPSDPGTTDPSDPGTTDPSDPGTTDPSDPGTTDPSDPGTTDPSNPGTTDPSNPGTTDPSDPGTIDPSNPGTTDPEKDPQEHVHTYDGGTVTKKADCEEAGEMTYTCTICGEKKTEVIPATGHSFSKWTTVTPPTLTEDGLQTRDCENCGMEESRAIRKLQSVDDKPADSENPGTSSPSNPGTTNPGNPGTDDPGTDDPSNPGTDDPETDDPSNPGTDDPGTTDPEKDPQEHVHTYDSGTVTRKADCETSGMMTYTCTECGEKKTEEIPATGHSFGKWTTITHPTLTEDGLQTRDCENCGMEESRAIPKPQSEDDESEDPGSDEPYLPPAQYYDPFIRLNLSEITLQTGQSTAEVKVLEMKDGDSVKSWKSSDTKIATVDKSGNITAKNKAGTATITVTTVNGAEATVKVTVKKVVTATKITGLKKKVTLKKGKTLKLKPVLKPAKAQDEITYKSSNSKIVKVNKNGKLTAKKKGTATITVKAGNVKTTVKVTVKK